VRQRDRIATAAVLAGLVTSVLVIGGASRWAVIAIAWIGALGIAGQVRSRRVLAGRSPLLAFLAVAALLTALQLIPLPAAIVERANPTAFELVVDGEAVADGAADADAWRPLSLDPATTRIELTLLLAYLGVGWLALRLASGARGRMRLLTAIAGVCGGVAAITLLHTLAGAERLYGVYAPLNAHPTVLGPLLNPNHLACLMVLGAAVATGLAFHDRSHVQRRVLWIVIAVACIAVALATRSRGGVAGLATAALTTTLLLVLQRWIDRNRSANRRDTLRIAVPAGVTALCGLVLAVVFGARGLTAQLSNTSLAELDDPKSKFAAWRSSIDLVEETPWVGVGRGAFESAFTRVHDGSAQFTFSHLENEYLQAVVDWGIPGAILLAGCLAWLIVVAGSRWRDGPLAAGALAGLAAVAVQSSIDFGLELPGVALPVIVVLATVTQVPVREASRTWAGRLRGGLAAAVLVAAGVVATLPSSTPLREDRAVLAGDDVTLADARAAAARHPLDYLAVAQVARLTAEPERRIRHLNHAIRLHPTHPDLHRAVARMLLATGRGAQARLEYRTAIQRVLRPHALVTEVLTVFPGADDATDALPTDTPTWPTILEEVREAGRSDVALRYAARVADAHADDRAAWRVLAELAAAAGDLELGERAARRRTVLDPGPASTVALARILVARGALDAVLETVAPLARTPATSPEHLQARLIECDVHRVRLALTEAHACLEATLATEALSFEGRRRVHGKLAVVYELMGDHQNAALERKLAGPFVQ
jgi:O-antigen ligase